MQQLPVLLVKRLGYVRVVLLDSKCFQHFSGEAFVQGVFCACCMTYIQDAIRPGFSTLTRFNSTGDEATGVITFKMQLGCKIRSSQVMEALETQKRKTTSQGAWFIKFYHMFIYLIICMQG